MFRSGKCFILIDELLGYVYFAENVSNFGEFIQHFQPLSPKTAFLAFKRALVCNFSILLIAEVVAPEATLPLDVPKLI